MIILPIIIASTLGGRGEAYDPFMEEGGISTIRKLVDDGLDADRCAASKAPSGFCCNKNAGQEGKIDENDNKAMNSILRREK
jgi:hypothetical protein